MGEVRREGDTNFSRCLSAVDLGWNRPPGPGVTVPTPCVGGLRRVPFRRAPAWAFPSSGLWSWARLAPRPLLLEGDRGVEVFLPVALLELKVPRFSLEASAV